MIQIWGFHRRTIPNTIGFPKMIRKKRMDEIMHSKAMLGGTSAFYQEKV
jgi:hypothetical protein